MELSKQVASLELSKRLKELGVKQESLFIWSVPKPENARTNIDEVKLRDMQPEIYMRGSSWGECFEEVAAYTSAELGEMLPWGVEVDGKIEVLHIYKDSADQWNFYPSHGAWHKTFNETEADARARLLIFLLENGLLKVEDMK